MKHVEENVSFSTRERLTFVDVTEQVKEVCARSEIRSGLVTVFSKHTTAGITVNERCERLLQDMKEFLLETVPARHYAHDEDTADSRANARSHLMSLLLGSSVTIPLAKGKLCLGTWQSFFFVELDGPRDRRTLSITIIGE